MPENWKKKLDISKKRREQQGEFEKQYLGSLRPQEAKASALELIGLYHVAKAAEILALFITDGAVEGNHQVQSLLDSHFDRAIAACDSARLVELEPIVKLLAATAEKLVNNSIWTVTRAVNSRVTPFCSSRILAMALRKNTWRLPLNVLGRSPRCSQ